MRWRVGYVAAAAATVGILAVVAVRTTFAADVETTSSATRATLPAQAPASVRAVAAPPAPAAGVAAAPVPADPTTAAPPPHAPRWTAAGALFDGTPDALGTHFCSASVVDSLHQDVVMTAAHCVSDGDGTPARTGMLFVPGYSDGVAPFGAWTVTAASVDPRFLASGDIDADVAFLTVSRPDAPPIQTVTGGFHVAFDPGSTSDVQAFGLPDTDDAPTIRTGVTTRPSDHQLQLDALGLYDGVSGGPWVRGGDEIVGVTGGYEQGGSSPEVSYASYLSPELQPLLAQFG